MKIIFTAVLVASPLHAHGPCNGAKQHVNELVSTSEIYLWYVVGKREMEQQKRIINKTGKFNSDPNMPRLNPKP